jgi:hypothetical protein
MVRPVENIRKDLAGLGEATTSLATEFSQIYTTYLSVLGQAMRRQVILAAYHLCTQVYPEDFLALSVGDRIRLQQGLQSLGRQGQDWLNQIMETGQPLRLEPSVTPTALGSGDLNRLEEALVALATPSPVTEAEGEPTVEDLAEDAAFGDPNALEPSTPEPVSPDPEALGTPESDRPEPESTDSETPPETEANLDPTQLMQTVMMAAMASDREEMWSDRPFVGDPLPPSLVAKHHLMVEQLIREVLQRVSKQANRLLRQAKILPDLPEALVEMASEADVGVPKGRSVPNVINVMVAMSGEVAAELSRPGRKAESQDLADEPEGLMVEADSEDEADILEANMTHLAAIHLRLADLEFSDVQAALVRGKVRTAVGKLRKLGKQYQQAERELAIAQAEQAWRSIWYDDSAR